jgi:hypothetical protein
VNRANSDARAIVRLIVVAITGIGIIAQLNRGSFNCIGVD